MSARDEWTVQFKCSLCGKTGEAELSQSEGWAFQKDSSTRIDSISDGFEAKKLVGNPIEFRCIDCDAKADPT